MPAPHRRWLRPLAASLSAVAIGAAGAGQPTPPGARAAPPVAPAGAGVEAAPSSARYWRATSPGLGALAYPRDFSAFVFGDLTGDPSAEGPVAAGGSVRLSEAALNTKGLGVGVVAGKDVDTVGGSIRGTIVHGGRALLAGTVVTEGAGVRATPVDFEWAQAELTALSDVLAARPATGTTVAQRWGGIVLSGADAALNVFEVSGEALARAPAVEIVAPAGAVVVVNVLGSRAAFSGCGVALSGGVDHAHLLWNAARASVVEVRAATVPGTVLAPRAAVSLSRGAIHGTVVAGSLAGGAGALLHRPFVGLDGVIGAGSSGGADPRRAAAPAAGEQAARLPVVLGPG